MSRSTYATALEEHFSDHSEITTSQLLSRLKLSFPETKKGTLHWHISELVKSGSLYRLSRGRYSFHPLPSVDLTLAERSVRYMQRIVNAYPSRLLASWDLSMLASFIDEVSTCNILFVQTDRTNLDDLFDTTLSISKDIYIDPDQRIVKSHILSSDHSIILQPLVSETPLTKEGSYYMLTIESIIVHLFLNKSGLFQTLNVDVDQVVKNIQTRHTINKASLLRLASRLNKKNQIEKYLQEIL